MQNQIDLFAGTGGLPVPRPARLIPFGKFEGQPYEVLLQDAPYALWLMNSMAEKLRTRHPELLAFLVSRYGIPDRTPEHNKLQNRFLDETFALSFAFVANPHVRQFLSGLKLLDLPALWHSYVQRAFQAVMQKPEPSEFDRKYRLPKVGSKQERLADMRDALLKQAKLIRVESFAEVIAGDHVTEVCKIGEMQFEAEGADVEYRCAGSIAVEAAFCGHATDPAELPLPQLSSHLLARSVNELLRVEVKPVVGDDYPAILRAMKAVNSRQLLVGEYNGGGATWQEVVKVFGMSNIHAVLLDEVMDAALPPEAHHLAVTPVTLEQAQSIVENGYGEFVAVL